MAAGQVAAELVEEFIGGSGEDVSESAQRPVDVLFSPEIQLMITCDEPMWSRTGPRARATRARGWRSQGNAIHGNS